MTVVLKPCGRGNWSIVTLSVSGRRIAPLLVKPGDRLPIGGVLFRVIEVQA